MIGALRSVSLTIVLAIGATAAHAQDVLRITGAVNYRNYPGFAKLLLDAVEKPVVLDITIPLDNEEAEGHLTTFVLDGQFELAYLAGPEGSKIFADTGFEFIDENYYTLTGPFKVMPAGVHDGQPWLQLEPAEEPAGANFKDVAAETLEPAN